MYERKETIVRLVTSKYNCLIIRYVSLPPAFPLRMENFPVLFSQIFVISTNS